MSDLKDNGIEAQKKIYIDAAINYKRIFAEKHDVSGMLLYMQKETQLKTQPLPYRKQGVLVTLMTDVISLKEILDIRVQKHLPRIIVSVFSRL